MLCGKLNDFTKLHTIDKSERTTSSAENETMRLVKAVCLGKDIQVNYIAYFKLYFAIYFSRKHLLHRRIRQEKVPPKIIQRRELFIKQNHRNE
jgi:hypothetical protein